MDINTTLAQLEGFHKEIAQAIIKLRDMQSNPDLATMEAVNEVKQIIGNAQSKMDTIGNYREFAIT